jgi:hypothetical protein
MIRIDDIIKFQLTEFAIVLRKYKCPQTYDCYGGERNNRECCKTKYLVLDEWYNHKLMCGNYIL